MSDQGKRRDEAGSFPPGSGAAAIPSAVPGMRKSPPFRSAVAAVAGRMRRLGPQPAAQPDDFWLEVRKELSELPQMRPAGPEPNSGPADIPGRRSSGRNPRALLPAPAWGTTGLRPAVSHFLSRIGRRLRISAPNGQDWFIAAALIAFFALGYLAALASGSMTS